MHPFEFFNLLTVIVDPSTSEYISTSDDGHKFYLKGRNVSDATAGAIKFYRWHETYPSMDNYELFITELNMALEASRIKIEAVNAQLKADLYRRTRS